MYRNNKYIRNKIKAKIKAYRSGRSKRWKARTWTAGRLVTIGEKVFRMKSIYKYGNIQFHRCVFCATMNHFRPCGYCKSEACTKCMRKSDLSCFPLRIR